MTIDGQIDTSLITMNSSVSGVEFSRQPLYLVPTNTVFIKLEAVYVKKLKVISLVLLSAIF